jgi:1-acyl-sn-glycerol-3-phosphate acyltransferase
MVRYGMFPVGLGNHLTFTAHEALAVKDYKFEELMEITEKAVKEGVNEYKQD